MTSVINNLDIHDCMEAPANVKTEETRSNKKRKNENNYMEDTGSATIK